MPMNKVEDSVRNESLDYETLGSSSEEEEIRIGRPRVQTRHWKCKCKCRNLK